MGERGHVCGRSVSLGLSEARSHLRKAHVSSRAEGATSTCTCSPYDTRDGHATKYHNATNYHSSLRAQSTRSSRRYEHTEHTSLRMSYRFTTKAATLLHKNHRKRRLSLERLKIMCPSTSISLCYAIYTTPPKARVGRKKTKSHPFQKRHVPIPMPVPPNCAETSRLGRISNVVKVVIVSQKHTQPMKIKRQYHAPKMQPTQCSVVPFIKRIL
jgi:hypothetical protein